MSTSEHHSIHQNPWRKPGDDLPPIAQPRKPQHQEPLLKVLVSIFLVLVVLLGAAIIANPKLAVRRSRNKPPTASSLIVSRVKGAALLLIALFLLMRVWNG